MRRIPDASDYVPLTSHIPIGLRKYNHIVPGGQRSPFPSAGPAASRGSAAGSTATLAASTVCAPRISGHAGAVEPVARFQDYHPGPDAMDIEPGDDHQNDFDDDDMAQDEIDNDEMDVEPASDTDGSQPCSDAELDEEVETDPDGSEDDFEYPSDPDE
jgi:hypothetical protein